MFARSKFVNTQIKRNKNGRKLMMKTMSYLELISFSEKTYNEFKCGKTIDHIFQVYAIASKHKEEYSYLLFKKFLKTFKNENKFDRKYLKEIQRFVDISDLKDLGFIYFIQLGNNLKIGRTKNILNRLNTYKSNSCLDSKIIELKLDIEHSKSETFLKNKLKNLGLTAEWFSIEHKEKIKEEFENRWPSDRTVM